MNRTIRLITLWLLLTGTVAGAENHSIPQPNWDRASAVAMVNETRAREELATLYGLARSGASEELLKAVQSIAVARNRPDPERDYILFELAMGLGDLGPSIVEPAVVVFLAKTPSRALVAHEDHPEMGLPLYNIRAAATGTLNAWNRQAIPPSTRSRNGWLQVLSSADPDLSAAEVRAARSWMTPEEVDYVLSGISNSEHHGTAAMILAEVSRGHVDRPSASALIFALLENRRLGPTAALALGRSKDPDTLKRLADIAENGTGLAAVRVRFAIETIADEEQR